ncbi:homeotic protein female sterile-like [Drosophila grimshawi]|uniref:homeotic protein female sterile-like n=1 Tax=Drosophila grimshawi TaxID=7222 RepID=UPI001C933A0B|nr:homeotic protein female sterile-like [Drosophila grimshawi]
MAIQSTLNSMGQNAVQPVQMQKGVKRIADANAFESHMAKGSVGYPRGNAWSLLKPVPSLAGRAGAGAGVAARAGGSCGTSKGAKSQGQRGGKGNASVSGAGPAGANAANAVAIAANATAAATTGGGTTNARRTENNDNNASNAGTVAVGAEKKNTVKPMSNHEKQQLSADINK